MNKTLAEIEQCLAYNKLKLIVSKTKDMIVSIRQKHKYLDVDMIDLCISNCRIDFVRSYKYLGLIIDCVGSFGKDFHYIHKKITKKLYFLSRAANFLSV